MPSLNRRSFLAAVAGGAAALSTSLARAAHSSGAASPPPADADLVLLDGRIITVDPHDTIAQAVAVRNGRIAAVGSSGDIRALAGPRTRVIDLKGRCVTPGFVDSHFHVMYYGQQFREGLLDIRFPKARTPEDLLTLIAARAKATPEGQWIACNQGFTFGFGSAPRRADLDRVAPRHPVFAKDKSGQFAVANSLALQAAGITRNTPDPLNARIGRDEATGEPNGLLFHYPAESLVTRRIPGYLLRSEDQRVSEAKEGQRRALAAGYTSTQDVIVAAQEDIDAYRRLAREGGLKVRLYILRYLATEQIALDAAARVVRFKDDWITFGGWKLAIDGGSAAGTCLMYDRRLPMSGRAYPYFDQPTLNRIVLALHRTGLQIAFHAGGDLAIDMVIDAVEAAQKASPRPDPRHRIEHALFPTPQALERIKRLGMVISTQPQWIAFHSDAMRQGCNDATMERFFPLKSMLEQGIPLAFGCDVPATIMVEPRYALLGAVERTTQSRYSPAPRQRLTMREALRVHTMGSVYASFEEHTKGSLEPDKLADMVVWSHDLYTATPRELRELTPLVTIVGGTIAAE